jgi:hypothetical protein
MVRQLPHSLRESIEPEFYLTSKPGGIVRPNSVAPQKLKQFHPLDLLFGLLALAITGQHHVGLCILTPAD